MDTIVGHFLGKRSLFTRKVVLGVDGAWSAQLTGLLVGLCGSGWFWVQWTTTG